MSKVCLGMIIKNEEFFLNRHLPVIRNSFDGLIVNDTGSTDKSIEILKNFKAEIFESKFENFSKARNAVIETAEQKGYDWMFMLDADECMFARDIEIVKSYMTEIVECIYLPRLEFVYDFNHIHSKIYNTIKRVFKLGLGYNYKGDVHEELFCKDVKQDLWTSDKIIFVPNCNVFHYGMTKSREERWAKHRHYCFLLNKEELPTKMPDNVNLIPPGNIEYKGEQPV